MCHDASCGGRLIQSERVGVGGGSFGRRATRTTLTVAQSTGSQPRLESSALLRIACSTSTERPRAAGTRAARTWLSRGKAGIGHHAAVRIRRCAEWVPKRGVHECCKPSLRSSQSWSR
jgi:hypothetical protein